MFDKLRSKIKEHVCYAQDDFISRLRYRFHCKAMRSVGKEPTQYLGWLMYLQRGNWSPYKAFWNCREPNLKNFFSACLELGIHAIKLSYR